MKKHISLVIVVFYLLVRFGADFLGKEFPGYSAYLFDFCIFFLVASLSLKDFFVKPKWYKRFYILIPINLILGALVFITGRQYELLPPFDFSSIELLALLLFIGPVTEELLFRFAIWSPLEKLANKTVAIIVTTVLFASFHFTVFFHADESYRPFIIYQTSYVFLITFLWGYLKIRGRSILFPLIAHLLFNLGFFLGPQIAELKHSSVSLKNTVVVVDLSFDQNGIASLYHPSNIEVHNFETPAKLDQKTCAKALDKLDAMMSINRGEKSTLEINERDQGLLENTIFAIHGAHVTGLIADSLTNWSVVHLGFSPTKKEELRDVENFIDHNINFPLLKLRETLEAKKPRFVQMAFSETFEENYADLKVYYPEAVAKEKTEQIMKAWLKGWESILNDYPRTYFIVAAGNGGVDGIGDVTKKGDTSNGPLPAVMKFSNIVSVGSLTAAECLSNFSNYPVDLAIMGEKINSWSLCFDRPHVALDGTSQASALATIFLAREYEAGKSLRELLSSIAMGKGCLQDRASVVVKY